MNLKTLVIIPARYASTRFPGKPLADIGGKTMIRRVYEQVALAKIPDKIVVATDDERIANEVKSFGGEFTMTSPEHATGTDRCFEAAQKSGAYDIVINVQGDEPFIHPENIDKVAGLFTDGSVQIATLAKKVANSEELFNPNVPKVMIDKNGNAIYFSRHPIPYLRGADREDWMGKHTYYKHIGIYAYRIDILKEVTTLERSPLEIAESLEQLRWLENGYGIRVGITAHESHAVDAPEDLDVVKKYVEK